MNHEILPLYRWRERVGVRVGRPLPLTLTLSPQAGRGEEK
jgi:hypothetical protein